MLKGLGFGFGFEFEFDEDEGRAPNGLEAVLELELLSEFCGCEG